MRGPIAASFMDDISPYQSGAKFGKKDKHEVRHRRRRFLASGEHALANSMRESVTAFISKPRYENPPTIYKVPQTIRQVNKIAYEPQILSIGPYHYRKERLQSMEKNKLQYRDSFLSRNSNYQLEDYIKEIEASEDEVRSYYYDNMAHRKGYKGNEFVKLMVLDGCFIVELFLKFKNKKEQSKMDPIFGTIWMLPQIKVDMLRLENQIPFFVLETIFKIGSPVDKPFKYSLAQLALDFFKDIMPINNEIRIMKSYHHLLHLLHSHLIPTLTQRNQSPAVESVPSKWNPLTFLHPKVFFSSSNNPQLPITINQSPPSPPPVRMKMIHCAAELQRVGIELKKREIWSSILDVKFGNGVLEIPPLLIQDYTDTIFRNLVAFEQCYPKAIIRFTTYLFFIDCIVNTSKDVALLHRKGIMDHSLGSDEEVAEQINRLGNGISDLDDNYLSDLYKDVEEHCKLKWNMLWASLRRSYFTNLWTGLSSIAASILLLVTFIQTFFTVFPYYRPHH